MISSSIQLGPIVFEDMALSGWSFYGLIDWWGQTSDKREVNERPQGHGAFAVSSSLRSSRAISFNANYLGGSQAELENALDELSAVGADGPVSMTVDTPAGSSSRVVSVEHVAPIDHRGFRTGRVAVDLIARDPRRYGVREGVPFQASTPVASPGQGITWPVVWPAFWEGGGSSGRILLTNAGKAPSPPTFILRGGFSSALITTVDTGARISLDRPVPVGSIVEIDTSTRRAMLDGQSDVSRWLRFREWEDVPPGATRQYLFTAAGDTPEALLIGRVFSAWW